MSTRSEVPPQAGAIVKARMSDHGVNVWPRFSAAGVSPESETRTTERHPKNTQGTQMTTAITTDAGAAAV
jgi:hypothetical protein